MATVALSSPPVTTRRADRMFYTGMAVAIALTVFAGFAPTYYLRGLSDRPALSGLLHVHGFLFTSWILLLLLQTTLVASGRTHVHRRLGGLGTVLAAAMVVVGVVTAIDAARRGAGPTGVPPLAFLIVPLGDIGIFGGFVAAAVVLRRRSEAHKRLILLGTISLTTAALGRLSFGAAAGNPVVFFLLSDLFIVAGALYDWRSRGRVHPAYIWGGLLLVASQPLRVVLSGTDAWLALAAAIVR